MKPRRLFLSAFLILSLFLESKGQTVPPELASMFDNTLVLMRNALGVKSLSAAVQLSDGAIWTGAYGISSEFPLDSVTPQHAYAIGSITKSITAACVLQLADEGKLNLDDSLHAWLPPYPHVNPNIRIRQLLNHTSGLYDVITNPAYDAANKANLDSVWSLHSLMQDYMNPPLFAPGTSWSYSNTNYVLLGLIIEAAGGKTYYEEYENRFFGPLQLPSLRLPPYDPNPARIAHLWIYNQANGDYTDAHSFYYNWTSFRTSAGPAGGYYGTARDVAVWNRAFLRGELHSPQIMDEAKTTVATSLPNSMRYGLGIMFRKFLGKEAYGHGGDIGYSSFSYYFPEKDISITVLNNDSKKISWNLATTIQALLKNCMDYEASVSAHNPLENKELKVSVSPNPFVEKLNVSVDLPAAVKSGQVLVSDALGRELIREEVGKLPPGNQNLQVERLESLSPGVYFVQLVLDGIKTTAVKILK